MMMMMMMNDDGHQPIAPHTPLISWTIELPLIFDNRDTARIGDKHKPCWLA
jgi:hypothetical protein